jgi:hypothetical protein
MLCNQDRAGELFTRNPLVHQCFGRGSEVLRTRRKG